VGVCERTLAQLHTPHGKASGTGGGSRQPPAAQPPPPSSQLRVSSLECIVDNRFSAVELQQLSQSNVEGGAHIARTASTQRDKVQKAQCAVVTPDERCFGAHCCDMALRSDGLSLHDNELCGCDHKSAHATTFHHWKVS
jgi:hypothetical protein